MTDQVVLDASAAISWLAPNQATHAAEQFADRSDIALLAPQCFRWEVRHVLLNLERRGFLPRGGGADGGLILLESRMAFDEMREDATARLSAINNLARANEIRFFDASYIELAVRCGAALASRDKRLLGVAEAHGLVLYDLQ